MAERIGDFLAKWWAALLVTAVTIIGMGAGWGVSTAQISALAAGQTRIEGFITEYQNTTAKHLDKIVSEISGVKTGTAVIQRDVEDLRDRLRQVENGRRQVQ